MPRGLKAPVVELNAEEREALQNWSRRPTTAQALAQRARIVLLAADGKANVEIAERLSLTVQTVGKWRKRFLVKRLDGLLDEPRPGAPRRVSDADVERVLARTLESRPRDATHWSTRSMAKDCGLSQSAVSRIWRAFALQPHRSETFKISNDPLFIDKVRDIVGLYLSPPDKAVVLCVDEKSQIQALDRTQPLLPMRPGQAERRTHDYVRHGTTSLFAALEVKTGRVIGELRRRHRSLEFRKFLNRIEGSVPKDLELHLILDNSSIHKAPTIRRWLLRNPRVRLHFTPTYSSWMNLVERWFSALTEKQIKRGAHRSTRELEDAIKSFIGQNNKTPKPFIWTKTADQILESLNRFCQRISNSGH